MGIAFATEEPTNAVIKYQRPLARNEKVVVPSISKNFTIMCVYMSTVILVLVFYGDTIFGLSYTYDTFLIDPFTNKTTQKA